MAADRSVPARERLRDKSNANAEWSEAGPRLLPQVWPAIAPSFVVPAGGTIFTIGSCFARNIEEHVARLGFRVPTLSFTVAEAERAGGRDNAMLNKYTPAAIQQEFAWTRRMLDKGGTVEAADVAELAFTCADGMQIDLQLGGFRPVSPERLVARRQALFDVFRQAFTADCVVVTLGLVETWHDDFTGLCIQQAPVTNGFRRSLDRFSFRRLDFATCRAQVQEAIDTVRAVNSSANFLITTSPVPLDRTFTRDDVITATMHGKSVLRAVCGEIVEANERVDYFPSYESVMLTRDWAVFQNDRRHVSDAFVGKIVLRLVDSYFREAPIDYRMAHAAYMASVAGESADASALKALWEASPKDVRAFAHYLKALSSTPAALADAALRYVGAAAKPEDVVRVARTAKRDDEEAATVIGAIASAVEAAAGDAALPAAYADLWRLWLQALLREERLSEALDIVAAATARWPDDAGLTELAGVVDRRARRAGLFDAAPGVQGGPELPPAAPAPPTPLDVLAEAFDVGDSGAIAAALGPVLESGAGAEKILEIAQQAKRAARDGVVSPRLAALADAVAAHAAPGGGAPDAAFFPLWRMLSQALWREDRRADAKAAAIAAADLWPDDEDALANLDAVKRKLRKHGIAATSADSHTPDAPPTAAAPPHLTDAAE
jgi:hypothetical protein